MNPAVNPAQIVNNEVLEIMAETGLLGLMVILGFIVFLYVGLVDNAKKYFATFEGAFLAVLGLVVFGVMIQYQLFSTLYITHIWMLLGLMAGMNIVLRGKDAKASR
jgi:O-antigen ligase